MKKLSLFLTGAVLLCTSFLAKADNMSDVFDKFTSSETYTVSLLKSSTDQLKSTIHDVTTSTNFTKVDLGDKSTSTDTKKFSADDDSDDDDISLEDLNLNFYLSSDKNSGYLFLNEGELGYPNYLKVEVRDLKGAQDTNVSLYTNLSEQALSFKGSNDNEVHLNFSLTGLLLELMGLSGDESTLNPNDPFSKDAKVKKALYKAKRIMSK